MRRVPTTLAIVAVLVSIPALAELTSTNPSEACVWLQSHSLNTGDWSHYIEDVYGCGSGYRDVGKGPEIGLHNNLAYYVQGDKDAVTQLKLTLNVNFAPSATAAKHELVNASQALAQKALGEKLPDPVVEAMMEGHYWSQRVGTGTVKVVREDWPTGKGYEIQVILE